MSDRQNISSGTRWERLAGYSRAVRVGAVVHVSGTTATDENGQVVGADAYEQSVYIFQKIERALQEAGASLADVVRTRIYVTDVALWEGPARAHAEFFGDIRPANTLIGGAQLVGPDYLVEIEAEAIIGAGT
jgi:enamine deaminase RidA (YjgF/YER057c/UK114 family)